MSNFNPGQIPPDKVPASINIGWNDDAQLSTDSSYNVSASVVSLGVADKDDGTTQCLITPGGDYVFEVQIASANYLRIANDGKVHSPGLKLNSITNPQSGSFFIEDWGTTISGPPNTNARLVRNGGVPQMMTNLTWTGTQWQLEDSSWAGSALECGNEGVGFFTLPAGAAGVKIGERGRFRTPYSDFCLYGGTRFIAGIDSLTQRGQIPVDYFQVTNGIDSTKDNAPRPAPTRAIAHFERITSAGEVFDGVPYADLTKSLVTPLRLNNKSTGTPGDGFGCGLQFAIQGDGITEKVMAALSGYCDGTSLDDAGLLIQLRDGDTLEEKARWRKNGLEMDTGFAAWSEPAPTEQPDKIIDPVAPSGGATVDTEARASITELITVVTKLIDTVELYGLRKKDNYESLTAKAMAYYPMQDNAADAVVTDTVGGLNGSLSSGTSADISVLDGPNATLPRSLLFDGVKYADSCGAVSSFNAIHQTNAWSIVFWVKFTSLARYTMLGSTGNSNEKGWFVEFSSGVNFGTNSIRVQVNKGDATPVMHAYSTDNAINDLNWHQVAITSDGAKNNLRFYIDKAYKFPTNYSTLFTSLGSGDATRVVNLGRSNDPAVFLPLQGNLAGILLYDFALTPQEIELLYDG